MTTNSPIPVILVHGYGGKKSHFFAVERGLREAGFTSIHAMKYNAWFSDIPMLARRLVHLVHDVRAETGAGRVHLVGHSLGGVIIRYAVCVLGLDVSVDTAITVASPHGGSPVARLGRSVTARQLRSGSDVLREIEEAARPGRTRWVAYSSNLDAIVPASRAVIRPACLRAENLRIVNQSHLSILVSPQLVRSVVHQLLSSVPAHTQVAA
jgi:triacylglycerol esterase/lipase EstA (alpha/beta hydrolase family)